MPASAKTGPGLFSVAGALLAHLLVVAVRGVKDLIRPDVKYGGLNRWMVRGVKETWWSVACTMVYDIVRKPLLLSASTTR